MNDPAPEGYVSLRIAFRRYCKSLDAKEGDLALLGPFVELLKSGALRTVARDPAKGERLAIPPEAWAGAWYVERPVLADAISGSEGEGLKPYAGRTPFVPETQLAEHLINSSTAKPAHMRQREVFPWGPCRDDFLMRVAEEGIPTVDGGEVGWRTQADAERWVAEWMVNRIGDVSRQPSESTIRSYVSKWLTKLRGQ